MMSNYVKDPFPVKKCPICGKEFVPAAEHAYRLPNKGAVVCSYHCHREARRKHESKLKKRPSWVR